MNEIFTSPNHTWFMSWFMLQCVAVCCSVLQCVAVCLFTSPNHTWFMSYIMNEISIHFSSLYTPDLRHHCIILNEMTIEMSIYSYTCLFSFEKRRIYIWKETYLYMQRDLYMSMANVEEPVKSLNEMTKYSSMRLLHTLEWNEYILLNEISM